MTECPNCGAPVLSTHRFCQYCGTELHPLAEETVVTPVTSVETVEGNSVMLVSLGTCTRNRAAQIIRELCGYSLDDATAIAVSTPTTVAQALTDQQAVYLAQALTEYGMEVSIYDQNGYRTPVPEQETVFSRNGSLLSTVLGVLGGIGAANRLARNLIRRQSYPHPYTGTRPPVFRAPARRVQARPVVRHNPNPKPALRSVPRPSARLSPHKAPAGPKAAPQPNRPGSHRTPGGRGPGNHGGPGGRR